MIEPRNLSMGPLSIHNCLKGNYSNNDDLPKIIEKAQNSWKLKVCILEAKKSIADSGCTLCVAKFANETDTTLSKIPYVVSIGNFTPNLNFQTRHGSNIQVVELHRLLVAVLTLQLKSVMKFIDLWDLFLLIRQYLCSFFKITLYGTD